MARGPDPNRVPETDPELSGGEQRRGSDMESTRSTRLGLSTGAIVLIALVIVVVVFLASR